MQQQKKAEQASVAPSSDIDQTLLPLPEGAISRFGRGMVEDLAFSPDGYQLVVGARTGMWWYELAYLHYGYHQTRNNQDQGVGCWKQPVSNIRVQDTS